jgi:uncharacterized damage-inducible protein DinB
MSDDAFSPSEPIGTRNEVFDRYLDYFRTRVLDQLERLPEDELRRSRLASGWTPLELVKHLTFVELRWLQWGFEGQEVSDPWGDRRDERWFVAETESREDVIAALAAQARRSRAIIQSNDLATLAQPGPRFEDGDAPTLERILLHLLQEYSHHLGHLDIVVEIALADRHT